MAPRILKRPRDEPSLAAHGGSRGYCQVHRIDALAMFVAGADLKPTPDYFKDGGLSALSTNLQYLYLS